MTTPMIAILGAGNMGASLIGGLIKKGHPADKIWATDIDAKKLTQLQQQFAVQTTTENATAVATADIVIFAVKPQFFAEVAKPLAKVIARHHPLIISIAAGIRLKSMEEWLGEKSAIIRTMPNTPALIGCGVTALFANDNVTGKERELAESILKTVGMVLWVERENLLDAVTALSGNGPAYFFLVMEALQDAGKKLGIPEEDARTLTLQTALGAARMAIENKASLKDLRLQVTSPGGTTEKAISVLEEHLLHDIFEKALRAGKRRSEELALMFGETK